MTSSIRPWLLLLLAAACSDPGAGPNQPTETLRATRLSFTTQPQQAVKDSAIPGPVRVSVLDQNGNVLASATNPVTLALATNTAGATLAGSATSTASSGVASFPGLVLDRIGAGYTLSATATGLDGATSTAFTVTLSMADVDGDTYSPHTGDCNDGAAAINPGADDVPDGAYVDSNCDGIDGDESRAVFVATTGADDVSCGARATPCLTIQNGLARAVTATKRDVYVAAGTYLGPVTLLNGIGLYGSFGASWTRGPAFFTTITGSTSVDLGTTTQALTILARDLIAPATIADFTIVGPDVTQRTASGQGRSSHAIVVWNVPPGNLTITRNTINAGTGADGAIGAAGGNAFQVSKTSGMDGGYGGNGDEFNTACNNTSRGGLGNPGINNWLDGLNGGYGGRGGTMDSYCGFPPDYEAGPGESGGDADVVGGPYGYGGYGGNGALECDPGQPGTPGRDVVDGAAGGGAAAGGFIPDAFWSGRGGIDGGLGLHGTGGGGGGGSGGCDDGTDAYGGGGGGGGAGGVRAVRGGGGGLGGGGSFAVFLINASPTITDNQILRGTGGTGGTGGIGGQGQEGGLGSGGALQHPGTAAAGKGGDGTRGGHAGGGGGGAGGISAGIYATSGASTPVVSGNVTSGGSPGAGGAGGLSAPNAPIGDRGNAGIAGANGTLIGQGTCAAPGGC